MKVRNGLVVGAALVALSLSFGHLIQRAEGADTSEVRLRKLEDVV